MADPEAVERPVQLLVEGRDGFNFFGAFANRLNLDHIQLQDFGGVRDLRGFLQALVRAPEFSTKVQSLGIIRDAEENADWAFQSVQSSLRNAELPVPSQPAERAGDGPAVSVLILPGNGQSGMLETLICESLADAAEQRCIDEFLKCVADSRNAPVRNPDKARVFAYLAAGEEPRHSVGVAAQRRQWDFTHTAFVGVRQFLSEL